MATPLQLLLEGSREDWLDGLDAQGLGQIAQAQVQRLSAQPCRQLVFAEHPGEFLALLIAAVEAGQPIFLGNPQWGQMERDQAQSLVQSGADPLPAERGWIGIPTGGSSGRLRFAIHTWTSLTAAIEGLIQWPPLAGLPLHSVCCLPLFHVSGLMQFLRALYTGGRFCWRPFRELETEVGLNSIPVGPGSLLSLVPTQLQRLLLLPSGAAWLRQFHCIFLGGAPAWPSLLQQARALRLPLAPTYGMTETAAMLASLTPTDFLAGDLGYGLPLPHVQLKIGASGAIAIRTASLALGYYTGPGTLQPLALHEGWYQPGDLGWQDEVGHLHVTGRASELILSGGENIWPAEVEAAIRSTGRVEDVAVLGWPDGAWGERVIAVVVADCALESLKRAIAPLLAPYKRPKQWLSVDRLPRNAQGKLNREHLRQLIGSAQGEIPRRS